MPTDDERREAARRLRDCPAELVAASNSTDNACKYYILDLLECVGLGAQNVTSLFERLADLIEPGEPKGVCGECGHFNTEDCFLPCDAYHGITAADVSACADFEPRKCDRDTLLALADEIEDYADGDGARFGRLIDRDRAKWYAHRIREALGVVE